MLRGESDLKFYTNLFRKNKTYIGGMRKLLVQGLKKIAEPKEIGVFKRDNIPDNSLIVFSGTRGYFQKLNGWDQFLKKEICAITRERWLAEVRKIPSVPIGIHIRRGDFLEPKSYQDFFTRGALKTPVSWFIESLVSIRNIAGFKEAYICSDGAENEFKDLLSFPGVHLLRTGSAIGDLLSLSKARLLLASGGSSFSAWASFFGQMPTLLHPGNQQTLNFFNLINRKSCYIGEYDPTLSPSESLVWQLKNALCTYQ